MQRSLGAQAVHAFAPGAAAFKKHSPSGGGLHPIDGYVLARRHSARVRVVPDPPVKSKAGEMLSVLMVYLLGKSGPCGRKVFSDPSSCNCGVESMSIGEDRQDLLPVAQTFDRTHVRR